MMPLADALQMDLFLCDGKTKPIIKGHMDLALPVTEGREVGFKPKVVASGFGQKEAYVIVEVIGDLWMLMVYDGIIKEVSAAILDKSKLAPAASYNNKTTKAIYDMVMPHVIGMWMREERNNTWSRLDEIADMGETAMGVSEEKDRAADRCGTG